MNERTYRISGKIINSKSRVGLGNLRIEAWDKDFIFNDRLGSAESDGTGNFSIGFNKSYFSDLFLERYPDIFFKIYQNGELAYTSRNSILWNVSKTELNIDIEVDIQPSDTNPEESSPLRVYGTVLDNQGKPVKYATVQAFDYDLRTKQLLNQTKTDAEGRYEITYDRQKFNRAEKDTADIQVHVFNDTNELLAQSATLFNVPSDIEINLVVSNRENISEWERITQTIMPLLDEQGSSGANLSPWELNNADIDFIVGDTQIDREQLRLWVTAAQMSHEVILLPPTSLPSNSTVDNTEWILFYGWFRDGRPQEFSTLIQRSVDDLMTSLSRAVKQNYIPSLNTDQLESIKEALQQVKIEQVLNPASDGNPASLGDLLNTIPGNLLDDSQRKKVVMLLDKVNHDSDDYMEKALDAGLDKNQALKVRQTLRLGDITLKYVPMVRALQSIVENDADGNLKSLTGLHYGQWLETAFEYGAPPQSLMTSEQYAEHLSVAVESRLPNTVLLAKLENQAIQFLPLAYSGIKGVLIDNPTFDIAATNIDEFVVERNIDLGTASALAKLQHLNRLNVRWDEAEVFVNQGIDSAEEITIYNKDQFKNIFGEQILQERLDSIHDQATALKAVSIGLMGYLLPMFYGVDAEVMNTFKKLTSSKDKIDSSPTLRKLFGALEQCHCDPCLSVLSPAAYLADLLNFIKSSPEADFELRRRRPDIYDLELSCDNSKIELPHIDIAIEILENAVALPHSLLLPVGTDIKTELDEEHVGNIVRQALQKTAADTLGDLIAHVDSWSIKPSDKTLGTTYWVVNDRYRTWYLEAHEGFLGLIVPGKRKNKMFPKIMEVKGFISNGNESEIIQNADKEIKAVLVESISSGIPLSVTSAIYKALEEQNRDYKKQWKIDFSVAGKVKITFNIDGDSGNISLTRGNNGKVFETHKRPLSLNLLNEIERYLQQGMLPTLLIQILTGKETLNKQETVEGFVVKQVSKKREYEYSYTGSRILVYNPTEIKILGLSYQSTATNRDLFARPQNRNLLAYEKLTESDTCFPWSLPYNFNLSEIRATLNSVGTTRLSLLELTTNSSERYESKFIAMERLGLSSAEWDLIVVPSIDTNGMANSKFWKIWGVNGTTQTIKDSFVDKDITAAPFDSNGLLTRISIILQQTRLSFTELQQLLETDFINPRGTINIQFNNVCNPSEMRFNIVEQNKLAPVLDRLHRFVRLWRATAWEIWELDIAIVGICSGNLNSDEDEDEDEPLIHIANLGLLKDRLNLPIDVLVAMIGGFGDENKQYTQLVDGEISYRTSLYDQLFQDRRLMDPPDIELAFNATGNSLIQLKTKDTLIAGALSIRPFDFLELLGKSDIDTPNPGVNGFLIRQNLQWLLRNVTLAKVLGLSLTDYERVWQLLGSAHFSSPETLLGFLDEIEFVHQSGFSWSELDYILRGTETDQSGLNFPPQRAAEILYALQNKLRQLKEIDNSAVPSSFALTENDLHPPLMQAIPSSDKNRWERWNLVLSLDDSKWSVSDPSDSSKTLEGQPLDLLNRIDVLSQQTRLTNDDLTLVLKTMYVDPATPQVLEISSLSGVNTIQNLSSVHLDRLERFLVLLRASKLLAYELDLLLQAFCKTDAVTEPLNWNMSNLIKSGQAVIKLSNKLRQPLVTIIRWWLKGNTVNRSKLAESLGFGSTDFNQLLTAFELVRTADHIDPFATPSNLLELVEFSQALLTLSNRFQLPLATVISWWLNGDTVDKIVLAESIGVDNLNLNRLLATFEAEKTINPLASPINLLEFVDTSALLKQRIELVTQDLAQAISLETSFVSILLWEYLHTSDTKLKLAMQFLISDRFKNSTNAVSQSSPINSDEYVILFPILVRLYKIALLNTKWNASMEELTWSNQGLTLSGNFSSLVFDTLPYVKEQITPTVIKAQLKAWKQSTTLYQLAHTSPTMAQVIANYLTEIQKTGDKKLAGRSSLEDSFTFSEELVATCFATLHIDTLNDYLDPLCFEQLIKLLGAVQKLGIDENSLNSLVAVIPNLDSAELGRKLLKTRFSRSGWEKALRQINNTLRIQQRDRLIDYLLAREGLRDVNTLYEYYLIDVEMSPCMNTTRMLQSTAAVQLFVQRCLFNLENVSPESIARDRWEWMQNYRVWEANRKVFLYPENWLFPEVRDDRTETFRTFESALTQSEPSHENATNALRQYLDDAIEICQISVLGMYQETHNNITTLYIVGRTQNFPGRYYWRKALYYGSPGTRWMGWERIDLDLSHDHLVPFVLGGNLHIAWPIVKMLDEKIDSNNANIYEIQLAITSRALTGWTQRIISRETVRIKKLSYRDERSMFMLRLRTIEIDSQFAIDLYEAKKPVFPSQMITVENPNKFKITSAELYRPPRGAQTHPIYWFLQLKVSLFVRYTDNNRMEERPCNVTIRGLSPDEYFGDLDSYMPDYDGVVAPLGAVELSSKWLSIWGNVPLRISASSGDVNSGEITFNFDIKNPELSYREPNGGDKYQAKINFLVSVAQDPNNSGEFDPLDMERRGSFLISDEKKIVWEPSGVIRESPPQGFLFFSSGYLETNSSGSGFYPVANASGIGRMFVLNSGHSKPWYSKKNSWYLEEGDNRVFIMSRPPILGGTSTNQSGAIYAGGFIDARMYRRIASGEPHALFDINMQIAPLNSRLGAEQISSYSIIPLVNPQPDARNIQDVQFNLTQPFANYNWEIFYHLPITVAIFLSRQQRFEDARKWFHYIFDPTTNDPSIGSERFWRFLPFRNAQAPDTITQLLEILAGKPNSHQTNIQNQVTAWLQDPFNPFAVARLRPSAFEWYTVIAYVKNLIAWADQLFSRDTRESINEATLLYIMAAQILGSRPDKIRANKGVQQPLSYRSLVALKGDLDRFSNVWLSLADNPTIKAMIKKSEWLAQHGTYNPHSSRDEIDKLSSIGSLYFCVPPNEKLPELWDTVEDRLFKIRHCQNLEGITRSLALYEPPIDPELLIRAKAAGLDLADVLADRFAPLPHYRFQVLLQKANEFCNEVKSLGGVILSTVEKKEAEHLALLRSSQEIDMLKLIESVKEEQVKEANANIEALNKTRNNALERFVFLQRQLGKNQTKLDATGSPIVEQSLMTQVQETGTPDGFRSLSLIQSEIEQIRHMELSNLFSVIAGVHRFSAGVTHLVGLYPAAKPFAEATGFALSATADGFGTLASHMNFLEHRFSQMAAWQRRRDEWVQQSKMTSEEIRQINKQIVALEIRKSITEKELENHRKQIEHTRNIDDYLRHMKFSGESLYGWMESQLTGLYFSAYQLAYELAKKAERAYQFELGEPSSSFIQFGHWDNLRKGLLSGERLSQNLRRMEVAHLERNRRELEITKHISLRQLDPLALMNLRETGECEFDVPEVLFDLDFPGHYFRRIKSVSVSVPCVVGPYSSVSGTLTLLSSKLRDKVSRGNYSNTDNYQASYLPTQSIATSSGQNDAGVFELNFRDERYLPFEGAGVISRWRFKLPENFRSFDYTTINDIVLHFRYTARNGGESLALAANENARTELNRLKVFGETDGLWQFIDLRHDYPEEWHRYNKSTSNNPVTIKLGYDRFPFMLRGQTIKVQEIKHSTLPNREVSITIDPKKETVNMPLQESDFKGQDVWIVLRYSI